MTIKELHFITDLLSYKPLYCLLRVLIVCSIGTACLVASESIIPTADISLEAYVHLNVLFVLISEINVLFSFLVQNFFIKFKKYRFTILLVLNCAICIMVMLLLLPVFEQQKLNTPPVRLTGMFIMAFIAFIILSITLLSVIRDNIDAKNEMDELRNAKIESENKSLREQLNPHFLFNNLSALKSLIKYEPEKAMVLIQDFTDIYRYILQSQDKSTVPLSQELEFAKSYAALHQTRMGEGLQVLFHIPAEAMAKTIVPMGLQVLIENAIKHNMVSKSTPLNVEISADESCITVKNNLIAKEVVFSTHKGLENIDKRYKLLGEYNISVVQTQTEFIVTLPLI